GVTLADRDLVNTDRPWSRRAGTLELRFHILHLKRFDGVPVQPQFRRNVLDRSVAAAPADIIGKALGVVRIVGQKVQPPRLPLAPGGALAPPPLQLEENARVPARQVAPPADLAVIPSR